MKHLLKANRIIVKIEQVILAGSILAMSLILIANVIGRLIFHHGINAAEETGQNLIIFVTFIGLSYCATTGKHINMLAIFDIMPGKMQKGAALLISGVTAAAMAVLTIIGFQYVAIMKTIGKVSVNLQIPMYWIILIVTLGFLFAAIQYALVFAQNLVHQEIYIALEEEYHIPVKEGR